MLYLCASKPNDKKIFLHCLITKTGQTTLPDTPTQKEPMQQENTHDFTKTIIKKHTSNGIYKLVVESLYDGSVNMSMSKYKQTPLTPTNNLWTSTFITFKCDGYIMDVSDQHVVTIQGITAGIDRVHKFVWSSTGLLISVSM
jgi:hypothetical protein